MGSFVLPPAPLVVTKRLDKSFVGAEFQGVRVGQSGIKPPFKSLFGGAGEAGFDGLVCAVGQITCRAHLPLSAPVDKAHAEQGKAREVAEEDRMREVAIGQQMRTGPERECQKQRMARHPHETGLRGIEGFVLSPPKENELGRAVASARIRQTGSITVDTTWFCHGAQGQSGR